MKLATCGILITKKIAKYFNFFLLISFTYRIKFKTNINDKATEIEKNLFCFQKSVKLKNIS